MSVTWRRRAWLNRSFSPSEGGASSRSSGRKTTLNGLVTLRARIGTIRESASISERMRFTRPKNRQMSTLPTLVQVSASGWPTGSWSLGRVDRLRKRVQQRGCGSSVPAPQ